MTTGLPTVVVALPAFLGPLATVSLGLTLAFASLVQLMVVDDPRPGA